MVRCKLIDTLPVANGLGESILWHDARRELLWTDMPGNQLLRYRPNEGRIEGIETPENLCSFGFIHNSDWLMCAFESGLARFHPDQHQIDWIWRLPDAEVLRLNDGRMDRQGRFWVGSLIDQEDSWTPDPGKRGQLYCLDGNGRVSSHLRGIRISNSLCWSPDGERLYFADSPRNSIYQFDFCTATGTLSNRRLFARTPKGVHPDGSIVDAEGCLWNAQWGSGQVVRYRPDGSVDTRLQLPVTQATCLTFGGEDLSLLYVTTANYGLSTQALDKQPQAGDVFVYQTCVRGLPENDYVTLTEYAA